MGTLANMIRTERQADVTAVDDRAIFILGDCIDIPLADDAVDLVVCSPPSDAQRPYGRVPFG